MPGYREITIEELKALKKNDPIWIRMGGENFYPYRAPHVLRRYLYYFHYRPPVKPRIFHGPKPTSDTDVSFRNLDINYHCCPPDQLVVPIPDLKGLGHFSNLYLAPFPNPLGYRRMSIAEMEKLFKEVSRDGLENNPLSELLYDFCDGKVSKEELVEFFIRNTVPR
jgi:hypothetical protein